MVDGLLTSGLHVPTIQSVKEQLKNAKSSSYDFCVVNLNCSNNLNEFQKLKSMTSSLRVGIDPGDLRELDSSWWSTYIVAQLDIPQSCNNTAILQRLKWICHMSLPAVILQLDLLNHHHNVDSNTHATQQGVNSNKIVHLLTQICTICQSHNVQVWLKCHTHHYTQVDVIMRQMKDYGNLGLILQLQNSCQVHVLHLFVGLNVKALCVNTGTFLTNKRGYPTLSKNLQSSFMYLFKRLGRTLRVIVHGPSLHKVSQNELNNGSGYYLEYLRYLRRKPEVTAINDNDEAKMELSYLDHLQSPLQPLGDDLGFATYEVFEKDPVKYVKYEEACVCAMEHLLSNNGEGKLMVDPQTKLPQVTVFVLGAGRGPLISCALKAAQKYDGKLCVKVCAIEKNPNAVFFLEMKKARDIEAADSMKDNESSNDGGFPHIRWSDDNLQILNCDMRNARYNETLNQYSAIVQSQAGRGSADILVSELLGSFGDNELSPECIAGAIKSLKAINIISDHCICIPLSYTSYIAPVSSFKLHTQAKAQALSQPASLLDGPIGNPYGLLRAMETPYVVRTYAASQTHKEKPVFAFDHSNCTSKGHRLHDTNVEDDGSCFEFDEILLFSPSDTELTPERGSGYGPILDTTLITTPPSKSVSTGFTIHGFLGTFEAILFGDVKISIAPSTFSTGMFSWFPLFMPLAEPMYVPRDASVDVRCARRYDSISKKVWYEWSASVLLNGEVLCCSNVHNPMGRSYFVRL